MKMPNKQNIASSIALLLSIGSVWMATSSFVNDAAKDYHSNDMSNTVGPILRAVAEKTCYGADTPISKGAVIMTKREERVSCINGVGNAVYARCFDYIKRGDEGFDESLGANLYAIPIRDVPLYADTTYSCIDEDAVHLPALYDPIRLAEIGQPVVRF